MILRPGRVFHLSDRSPLLIYFAELGVNVLLRGSIPKTTSSSTSEGIIKMRATSLSRAAVHPAYLYTFLLVRVSVSAVFD